MLEIDDQPPYYRGMTDPTKRSPADWEADIAISMAQIAAGDIVPAEPVIQRIRETIARLEEKRGIDHRRKAAPHR